jgi:hypothetical protein
MSNGVNVMEVGLSKSVQLSAAIVTEQAKTQVVAPQAQTQSYEDKVTLSEDSIRMMQAEQSGEAIDDGPVMSPLSTGLTPPPPPPPPPEEPPTLGKD